jgi:hypothetical protein
MLYVCNIVKEAAFDAVISKKNETCCSRRDFAEKELNACNRQKCSSKFIDRECEV